MLGLGQYHLYKQIYADDTLTEAWRKVRTGTELAGVDGVTIAHFQARLFGNLKALQTDLERRRYVPQPVKRLSIPKPDGTKRPLGILTVRDRIAQRAILLAINPIFEATFEECSHGFRKERSVATALNQVTRYINLGFEWMVDFDIAACFESIPTSRLRKCIREHITNAELRHLLDAFLDVEAAAVERLGHRRKHETRGILQGGILSPLFANIYLDRFDKAALKCDLKLVRYADDGIVCCKTQHDANAALKRVDKLLGSLDLSLNPRKTAIQHVEKGFDYLGERFFLRHQGYGSKAVLAPSRALAEPSPSTTVTYQPNGETGVWEPST